MNSRTLTGSLLIAGPLLMVAMMILLSSTIGDINWNNSQETIAAFASNLGAMKTGTVGWAIGELMILAGLIALTRSMAEGPGAHYAAVGITIMIVTTSLLLGEGALNIGASQTAADGHQATAGALYAGAGALGGFGNALNAIGFGVVGIGLYLQGTFNKLVSGFVALVGIAGTGLILIDYRSDATFISFIGLLVANVAMGISLLVSKK